MTSAPVAIIPDYSPPTASGGFLTQTIALILDAYRDLNSRRLFWITLLLSLLIVAGFGFVGINAEGIKIFAWQLRGMWNSNIIPPNQFYKWLFTALAIPVWLGLIASILALISVGGMFPDMLTGGAIDLYLAKPISRLRLFLTKYLCGLMFVALQVFVFCAASVIVIGTRGGTWEWRIFLAVPLVTLFFSYLFCVCVLLGVLTRSTLAAILVTLLLWGMLYVVNASDGGLTAFRVGAEHRVARQKALIAANEKLIDNNNALPTTQRSNMSGFEFQLTKQREALPAYEETAHSLQMWSNLIYAVKTPLPKTGETVQLMSRWLVDPTPFYDADEQRLDQRQTRRAQRRASTQGKDASTANEQFQASGDLEVDMGSPEVSRGIQESFRQRSAWWIIGTSLGFEVVILGIASFIFCRRDF
jgi:ABC-type transport system involved in multi-copper enzyme maturation permease subunit